MIRRDIPISHWKRTQYGPNTAALQIQTDEALTTIINVYNPRGNAPSIGEWPRVQEAIANAKGEIILLGDFNTHHSQWGGIGIACEQQGDHLLNATKREGLQLLTQQGEITWKRGDQESTIDLTFATQALSTRVEYCGTEDQWALTQDHIPIKITLDLRVSDEPQETHTRYALKKLNLEGLSNDLQRSQLGTLEAIQQTLEALLPRHCPKAKPSPRARPEWSPRASELLAGARRARRRHNASREREDLRQSHNLANQLKQELRKNSRANWRRLIQDLTNTPNGQGLWKLSRWSRRAASETHADPHMPALRRRTEDEPSSNDQERTQILIEKFFPPAPTVQIEGDQQPISTLTLPPEVSYEEMYSVLMGLPTGKAPGPTGIPNEILKATSQILSAPLAQATSKAFAAGELPGSYKETTTIALRKEGKKDYSLPSSYRPIALENALAKAVEKVLANRITNALEEYNLLPWSQMGARRGRSTLSAIGLLTACVEAAWKARPGCTVSMLSLDIAGAFDNVPHARLLQILKAKGFPDWLVKTVASFLQGRRTRIAYTGYKSNWIDINTGIPQGSPLSPILFLLYISGLPEMIENRENNVQSFGFVDDTNIITWGTNVEDNCRKLSAAHTHCEEWARLHGAKFAPEKYQLIHFTRSRVGAREQLAHSISIEGHEIKPETKAIRVLGVWLDPKLTWKEHIAQAARKGLAASSAMARLAASTWGPSARNTRLLYTAIVRPTLLYGAQEWSTRIAQKSLPQSRTKPLEAVQNACLRRITGGYQRTPRAVLEKETQIPPLDIYMATSARSKALRTRGDPLEKRIRGAARLVWNQMRRNLDKMPRLQRTQASDEAYKAIQEQRVLDAQARTTRTHNAPRVPDETILRRQAQRDWKARWEKEASRHRGARPPAAWSTPWEQDTRKLYAGLSKAQATALFWMRTEVIGLNGWLASIHVPNIQPHCQCGWRSQTVRHILLHCPMYDRRSLLQHCGTERLDKILTKPESAAHAARWIVASGALAQLRLAREIEQEETTHFTAFEDCEQW